MLNENVIDMKLIIKETAWGINRVTGKYKEAVTAKVCFNCELGELPVFGKGGRHFIIEDVGDGYIKLSVRCADERHNKTWIVEKGEDLRYRPRSFDGGYFYDFVLK